MIQKSHPYWHVRSIVENRPDIVSLQFSYYNYQPQTVEDNRTVWNISRQRFLDPDEVDNLMVSVPLNHEFAINSNVRLDSGEIQHIAMVDMSTTSKAHLLKLRAFLGDNFFEGITWYSSGRSFHGYGDEILSHTNWIKFMGLLLLVNQPKLAPTVDPRWIGHRLLAGFSALRWTKNTEYYLSHPTLIENIR
ncbi:primase 1D-like protein [Robbsia andropogonis]|uniref:primase 1D-like protein n=1 Tax=Robbsia andropogonis TaxID=28092 RepID=UPI0012F8C113|nr:hypothetical protein [Robbsia andropogonis]